MKRITPIALIIFLSGIVLAQPGRPGGPGGQYGQRMEMMTIWKLTDHLDLTEDQAEKFFPRMREHRKNIQAIQKEELEYFKSFAQKIKKGEEISEIEMKKIMSRLESLEEKKLKGRLKFVKESGDILTPNQQAKLLMFEGKLKQDIRDKIREHQNPRQKDMRRTNKNRRF